MNINLIISILSLIFNILLFVVEVVKLFIYVYTLRGSIHKSALNYFNNNKLNAITIIPATIP